MNFIYARHSSSKEQKADLCMSSEPQQTTLQGCLIDMQKISLLILTAAVFAVTVTA